MTCLAGALLLWQLAGTMGLYQEFSRRSNDGGVAPDLNFFVAFFRPAYGPPIGALMFTALATAFAFRRFR